MGTITDSVLSGGSNLIETNGCIGYVGVYEGLMLPALERNLSTDENGFVHVTLDIIYTEAEAFAVLTIGDPTETYNSEIIFYGEFTPVIADVSSENAKRAKAEKTRNIEEPSVPRINASPKYQGSSSTYMGSHKAGELSVVHADELSNQGVMTTSAKVNSQSASVKSYLSGDMGYGSLVSLVYPDDFKISMCGYDNYLHAVTNSYLPQEGFTTATIPLPVYGGPVIGLQFISINVTMSSTTVTRSRYTNSSPSDNNRLAWEMYKLHGWNASDYDGDYSTGTGMAATASYTYEGDMSSSFSRSMYFTGQIRYEYWVTIMGTMTALHLSTSTMGRMTSVTIFP